jgi:hypothetical protein
LSWCRITTTSAAAESIQSARFSFDAGTGSIRPEEHAFFPKPQPSASGTEVNARVSLTREALAAAAPWLNEYLRRLAIARLPSSLSESCCLP